MELWNQRVLDWNHVTRHMEGSYGCNGTVLRMYLTSDTIRLYHHLPSNPSVCTVRPLSFGLYWAIQMAYVGWFGFMHRNILFCICILEFTHMLSCLLAFEFRLPPRRRFSFFGIWHNPFQKFQVTWWERKCISAKRQTARSDSNQDTRHQTTSTHSQQHCGITGSNDIQT